MGEGVGFVLFVNGKGGGMVVRLGLVSFSGGFSKVREDLAVRGEGGRQGERRWWL